MIITRHLYLLSLIFFLATTPLYSMKLTTQYQDSIEQEYFRDVPEKYKEIIRENIDYYKKSNAKETYRRMYHFHAITAQEKYSIGDTPLSNHFGDFNSGYWILKNNNPLCSGRSNHTDGYSSLSLNNHWATTKDKPTLLKKLTDEYKIHLMPKGSAIEEFDELIQLIKNDTELGKAIVAFKILFTFKDDEQIKADFQENKTIFPKIVIYAASGKENAQFVLSKIYAAFKDKEGLDIAPRCNQKITNYIYYAHGNGGDKEINEYKDFFEQPDMIHYKSKITGQLKNYYLDILPGEKRQLTEAQKLALQGITTPIKTETISTSWKPISYIKNNFIAFMSAHYKKLILIGCLPLIYLFISRIDMLYRN